MQQLKKLAALTLALVMVVTMAPLSFAGGNSAAAAESCSVRLGEHEHSLEYVEAKASTCQEQGNVVYWVCGECGKYFSDDLGENELTEQEVFLPKAAHQYKQTIQKNPSCEVAGVMRYTCSECSEYYEEPIKPLGHTWGKWQTLQEATCTQDGEEQRICKVNKKHIQTRTVPASGHKYGFEIVLPQANALGYTVYTCSNCGDSYKEKIVAHTGKVGGFRCAARTAAAQKLVWNTMSGVSGYQLQISNAAGTAWGQAYATTANTYLFKNLTAGAGYKFRIRTFIKGPDGKNYFAPWVMIISPTLPSSTALTKLTPASKAFTAQWKKKAVTGYQLQFALKSDFSGAKTVTIKNAGTLKYAVKSLKAKTNYYVRIRTYKTISKVNYFSPWSAGTKVKTK